jgi:hypothetical protein
MGYKLLVVLYLLFAAQEAPAPINLGEPLSVCEVLMNLPRYRGKVIEIRGEYRLSVVVDPKCSSIDIGDRAFPPMISLAFPNKGARWGTFGEPSWDFSETVYQASVAEWERQKERGTGPVLATIVGRLDAPEQYAVDRQGHTLGVGVQGMYAASLVMVNIKNVSSNSGDR